MNGTPTTDSKTVIEPSGFTPLGSPDRNNETKPPNYRRAAVAAVLVLFALAILFLLQARSVHLKVLADSPARINVSGFALPLGDRYLMRPGSYDVGIAAAGYEPMETTLAVTKDDSQTFEFALQSLPGRLVISSSPVGAEVSVDGAVAGQTPLEELVLSAGQHELTITHPRHFPARQTLEITGRNMLQQLVIELPPAWAEVTVSSVPAGAEILVDGVALGTTPRVVELLEGQRSLALRAPGFAEKKLMIPVEAGIAQNLNNIALEPAAGNLQLSSKPSGANVTLNGEFKGQTPLLLQLTPGEQQSLAVLKPGYQRHTQALTVTAGSSKQLEVALKAQLGTVRFRVTPISAVLRINGKRRRTDERTLSLPALEHEVLISLEGYAPQRKRFTPRPGLEQQIVIDLKTTEEALLARLKPMIETSAGQTLLLFNPAALGLQTFTMGASRRDPGRRSNEVLRPVTLERLFYLQTTEVSNAQFRKFQADHKSGQVKSRSLNREQQPAVQLSWQQAASYCNWLSRREGLQPFYLAKRGIIVGYKPRSTGYRLPTEAEWAWAARNTGSTLQKFPWGDSFPPQNMIENYADKASAFITGRVLNNYVDEHLVSAPIGSYQPNRLGLYDMGGNVAEWVHDVYAIPEPNAQTAIDPRGQQRGDNYVIRGASWSQAKLPQLRLSHRDYGQAGRDDVGFRVARYAE